MIYDVLLPTEHAARSIVLRVCYLNILANDREFKQKRFQPEVRHLKIKKGPETNMLQDYNF